MIQISILNTRRGLGVLIMLMGLLALLLSGCNDDEISKLPEAQGGPLILLKAKGGTINVEGTQWLEPCMSDGGGNYRVAFMVIGTNGSRTETDYAEPTCLTPLTTKSFPIHIINNGTKFGVLWSLGGAPPFHTTPFNATKVTISGNDGTGPFNFNTILLYDDIYSPHQLLFGDDSPGNLDGQGYPNTMFEQGAIRQ